MATATASAATLPGVSASIWADKPMPPRGGWGKGSDSGSGFRGAPRGGSRGRGRGGRGGRGGSGGRSSQTKAPAANPETDIKQPDGAQKDQAPSTFQKATTPQSPTTTSSFQTNGSTKGPNKVKPPRKNSDQRPPRKQPPLGVDTLNVTPSNASSSPSVSPRTPNRRKRSNAQKSAPPPPPVPTNHARKQSIASEQDPTHAVEKPAPAPPPARELPPHMAPAQPNHAPSDIAHNIDALVERVRAVAMDRPTTPGNHSHFDWAEDDEDDSLPDLDDWGVTSSLSTTGPITEVADGEKIGVSVISPILQDTLRPLPNIVDIDISTPSIKLHDVNGVEANLKNKADQNTSHLGSAPSEAKVETPAQEAVPNDKGVPKTQNSESSTAERSKSPSPPRGLTSSIHASHHAQSSLSPPPPRFPNPPRGGFNPSHNRAHTVGEQTKEASNPDRTRRSDRISHGRNHSTPHTGPGTATAHARAIHHTRPVISGDAISRLARSLGGAVPKREREAAATANA